MPLPPARKTYCELRSAGYGRVCSLLQTVVFCFTMLITDVAMKLFSLPKRF